MTALTCGDDVWVDAIVHRLDAALVAAIPAPLQPHLHTEAPLPLPLDLRLDGDLQ